MFENQLKESQGRQESSDAHGDPNRRPSPLEHHHDITSHSMMKQSENNNLSLKDKVCHRLKLFSICQPSFHSPKLVFFGQKKKSTFLPSGLKAPVDADVDLDSWSFAKTEV